MSIRSEGLNFLSALLSNIHADQLQKAVDAVITHNFGDVPFLISGPPGTGKTKTIVEIALQLLQKEYQITPHILLCAPSDPAADTLALRLSHHLNPMQLFRLNGPTRTFAEVPDQLLSYTFSENETFSIPEFKKLMSYKIVVTTCRDADVLVQARLTNADLMKLGHEIMCSIFPSVTPPLNQLLHWTALLVDEAAQATEPEACVPLTVVATPIPIVADTDGPTSQNPVFVMAGDQNQLGPRTSCRETALSISLFERLFSLPLYASHALSRHNATISGHPKPLTRTMLPMLRPAFTNLTRNYRSHPSILVVPSALFYSDTLIPEAIPPHSTSPVPSAPFWRGPHKWPILFAVNTFPDVVDPGSLLASNNTNNAITNHAEALKALRYAQDLLSQNRIRGKLDDDVTPDNWKPIAEEEICIISPFASQVAHLRKIFRHSNLAGVNIGPLEVFQGLESRFVILCTTRTRPQYVIDDQK